MERLVHMAWGMLALVHAAPAMALVVPGALRRLYGLELGAELRVLLVHRSALFLALVVLCGFALFDPAARRAAGVAVAISVVAYLVVYSEAGFPAGALRRVALVDAFALGPLVVVLVAAWRTRSA
jgi:hypothetical protein